MKEKTIIEDKKICGYCKYFDTRFPDDKPLYSACELTDKEIDYYDKSCKDYEIDKFRLFMIHALKITGDLP